MESVRFGRRISSSPSQFSHTPVNDSSPRPTKSIECINFIIDHGGNSKNLCQSTESMTYLIFSTTCLIVSVTVGMTVIRVRFGGFLSSSISLLSPSVIAFFRFAAINWRYARLCRGPLGLGWFNGGAANHKTSLVSGSRSNNLATQMN